VGDIDRDGDLDVFATGATGSPDSWAPQTTLLRNDGQGSFVATAFDVEPLYAGTATLLDVNNDARAELLLTGITADGSFRAVLYENLDGTPEPGDLPVPGLANGAVAPADFDGDGDLDVAITGRTETGRFFSALLRNDDGQFVDAGTALARVAFGSLDWSDFDNDGDPDLLLTGGVAGPLILDGVLRIYRNDDGALVDSGIELPGPVGGAARWGDYDLDGRVDIVWTGASNLFARGATYLYRNEGDNVFVRRAALPGVFPADVRWGDFDRDGDQDLTLQGLGGERLPVLIQYQNDQLIVNRRPSAPEGLEADVSGSTVSLSWDAATDPETESALTYSIRLGSQPGLSDVVHPDANAETGGRLRTAAGNVWHNRSWVLRDLPAGTYFWAVQAVDGAHLGGPFSAEGSFTIGEGAGSDVTTYAEATDLPRVFAIRGSYPNPFRDDVRIRLDVPSAQNVRLEVHDLLGNRLRVLDAGRLGPGAHEIVWDGRSESGVPVAAGVYLYRIRTSSGWTGAATVIRLR
jgi:hypothetical protein